MTSTRTGAILEVSKKTYEEIAEKMRAAGYDHVFLQGRYGPEHMDLNGIMLRREQPAFDHSKRTTKYFEKTLGFCICEHCEKLPDNGPRVEDTPQPTVVPLDKVEDEIETRAKLREALRELDEADEELASAALVYMQKHFLPLADALVLARKKLGRDA